MGGAQMRADRRIRPALRRDHPGAATRLHYRRLYVPMDACRVRRRADPYLRAGLCAACAGDPGVYPTDLWDQERPAGVVGAHVPGGRALVRATRMQGAAYPRRAGWAAEPERDGGRILA